MWEKEQREQAAADRRWDDYVRGQPGTQMGELKLEQQRQEQRTRQEAIARTAATPARGQTYSGKVKAPKIAAPHIELTEVEKKRRAKNAWGLLGFIVGGGWALTLPEMTGVGALVVGVIIALILRAFYKPILIIAAIGFGLWLFA